jgi:lysophospholipase L1-like esterase
MPMTIGVSALVGVALASIASLVSAQKRFLALGDSYTIGEGVTEAERWPVQLVKKLQERDIRIGAPQIIATTGWTTDELDAAIDAARPAPPYELVTLLIGVNDQYRGRSVDEYRTQFKVLLERALYLAGMEPSRVIVVSIPDWGVTPFNRRRDKAVVAREIDAFNAVNREEAAARQVQWLDITDLTRAEPTAVVDDGLHPSAAMYAQWTERLVPLAVQALRR